MDGTILDTEKHYRRLWVEADRQMGYNMTGEQALSLRSLGRPYAPVRINGFFDDEEEICRAISYKKSVVANYLQPRFSITIEFLVIRLSLYYYKLVICAV
jgi:DNA helicase-2/ATP-dependent DNA helicase PcrA